MTFFNDKIKNIIENKKSVSLRFLTLSEQKTIRNYTKEVTLYGGYNEAERKRATFYSDYVNNITCFKISYNQKHLSLSHQNILGTLMSLSISFDSIGDILPKQGLFFCTTEIEKELINSFTSINNVPITLEVYTGTIQSEIAFEDYKITSSSLRLDLIVSKITKLSRTKAQEMIDRELVKVNHVIETKYTKTLREEDVLSIRKHGRIILRDTSKTSKKGKIIVKYQKYV